MEGNGAISIELCERTDGSRLAPKFEGDAYIGMVQGPRFHAQVKGRPDLWACGKTKDDAVLNLIRKHFEVFGLEIVYIGIQSR